MKRTSERLRRAKKIRSKLNRLGVVRITVHKSSKHIYAQLIDAAGKVLASASTLDKQFKAEQEAIKATKSEDAVWVGTQIGKKAVALGITQAAFDRSGFKYHGRVLRLADAARAAGVTF